MAMDTIFAVASGAGRGGVAIIRVSGPGSGGVLEELTQRHLPRPRMAARRPIKAASGDVIDEALVLWFPKPQSFTGEDVAELHVHGGMAVIAGVLETLAAEDGLRPAEAGEFTRRAFENGKLDLTEAEGLADLVNAETEAQRRQALRQMHGALGEIYESWRDRLVRASGHLEATIDFSDEDLPSNVDAQVYDDVASLRREIEEHLSDGSRGERIRNGIRLAIIGPPNAGKSSILNILAKRDAAIVSPYAGTTRDVIEVPLDVGGFPVIVADTAGMRDGAGEIEEEGVRRARTQAVTADLKLAVFDGALWPEVDTETKSLVDENTIVVVNKSDLGRVVEEGDVGGLKARVISALTGRGVDGLMDGIEEAVSERFSQSEAPGLTRVRHRTALKECEEALARCTREADVEMAAEDLRLAARALGRITGRVDVEDVLDVIFRDFCIGK